MALAAGLTVGLAGCDREREYKTETTTPGGKTEQKTEVEEKPSGEIEVERKTEIEREGGPTTEQKSETEYGPQGEVQEHRESTDNR
jgi:hypothetical protein